ncbi:MAG: hypothetical protein WBO17_02300 [Sphingorhabdus sp.]
MTKEQCRRRFSREFKVAGVTRILRRNGVSRLPRGNRMRKVHCLKIRHKSCPRTLDRVSQVVASGNQRGTAIT